MLTPEPWCGHRPHAGDDPAAALRRRGLDPGALTVLVMAKAPVPGRVKTRLCPPLTATAAARLAAAALLDTVDSVDRLDAASVGRGGKVIALDGSLVDAVEGPLIAGRITSAGWTRIPQRGTSFADRLVLAHGDAAGRGPVLQIGMDTPQLSGDLMAAASEALFDRLVDAVVGPASDGGGWSLGVRNAQMARALGDVPMSTSDTGELTIRALRADGLRVALLPVLTDVDNFDDAAEVAGKAPGIRFARAFRTVWKATAA